MRPGEPQCLIQCATKIGQAPFARGIPEVLAGAAVPKLCSRCSCLTVAKSQWSSKSTSPKIWMHTPDSRSGRNCSIACRNHRWIRRSTEVYCRTKTTWHGRICLEAWLWILDHRFSTSSTVSGCFADDGQDHARPRIRRDRPWSLGLRRSLFARLRFLWRICLSGNRRHRYRTHFSRRIANLLRPSRQCHCLISCLARHRHERLLARSTGFALASATCTKSCVAAGAACCPAAVPPFEEIRKYPVLSV